MTNEAGHFDSHGSATVQYEVHCPMEDVQGYIRSHWMLPSGNYLLRNAPAAARVTAETTTMGKYTLFAGHFDGHGYAPVCYCVHC